MTETFIGVRNVDEKIFRKFKASMTERKMKLGKALTNAMDFYMKIDETQNKPVLSNLLNMKQIYMGKKVKWSKEIDETIYT